MREPDASVFDERSERGWELGWNHGVSASSRTKRTKALFLLSEGASDMAKTERKPDHGADKLYALRHSTAHVMAGAVLELMPDAKFGFGPPIADGFYYDFDLPRPLQPEDLEKIEAKMREVVKADHPFEHRDMSVSEALAFFGKKAQTYKVDQIEKLAAEGTTNDSDDRVENGKVSLYQHNGFVDLCRGPHVARTGDIKAFKLLSIAGAYWRGSEHNPQLQRIYGTVWASQGDLDAYLERLKEIERRDHRTLGRALELFEIDNEVGAGLVLWLPNGSVIREELENWWRQMHHARGYTLVYTPHLATSRLYSHSGHLDNFAENMFGPIKLDNDFWVKPMNCPGHIKIFQSRLRSYRELPLRIAEIGAVYRNERGGTLHGMLRVRSITQDDSHIFCTRAQLQAEIESRIDFEIEMLRTVGYDFRIELSTRPEKRLGTDALWDDAEDVLSRAAKAKGLDPKLDVGGGAFYGPKLSFMLVDAIGREWQGCTIQLDYNLPERFDVTYVNDHGDRERPVMVHSVLFGAMERFVGGLIEHYAANFPLWLSWEQIAIVPIRESATPYAMEVADALRAKSFRVHLDDRATDMRTRIKEAQTRRASYTLVIGDKEAETKVLSLRRRGSREEERGVAVD